MNISPKAIEKASKVKMVIFDVDGVLTDGGIYVGVEGELFKPFFCRDGLGITLAHKAGLRSAIITGRTSKQLSWRAKELHITEVMQGHLDKRAAYLKLKEKYGLRDEDFAYIGDDVIDLPIMLQVGFPAAVSDAIPEVKSVAGMVAASRGGHGAVREILQFILESQGKWEKILASFYDTRSASDIAVPGSALGLSQ